MWHERSESVTCMGAADGCTNVQMYRTLIFLIGIKEEVPGLPSALCACMSP